jgi:hypothetical protein
VISQSKFNGAYKGLTVVAQKVFNTVPISEPWSMQSIAAELRRTGSSVDFRVLGGCLNTLVDAGLIKEVSQGCFQREEVRPVTEKVKEEDEMAAAGKLLTVPQKPKSSMDQLEVLAKRAADLGHLAKQLSADIGELAINIGLQAEAEGTELTQLRQLKTILQGLK